LVGGFNHNFNYKGHMYHVQTEDSGLPRAHVTTLLYRGGSILAREVKDYRDLCGALDLAAQVEHMMKNQHRMMLKNLKDGVFDARIAQLDGGEAHQAEERGHTGTISVAASVPASADETVAHAEPAWRKGKLDNMVRTYLDAGR